MESGNITDADITPEIEELVSFSFIFVASKTFYVYLFYKSECILSINSKIASTLSLVLYPMNITFLTHKHRLGKKKVSDITWLKKPEMELKLGSPLAISEVWYGMVWYGMV